MASETPFGAVIACRWLSNDPRFGAAGLPGRPGSITTWAWQPSTLSLAATTSRIEDASHGPCTCTMDALVKLPGAADAAPVLATADAGAENRILFKVGLPRLALATSCRAILEVKLIDLCDLCR